MLLGPSLAAGGRGIQARLMPPARWRRIAGQRRQRAVRESLFRKAGERAHIPQEVLREDHLTLLSLLVEADPVVHARDLSLDADELTLLLHDRKKAEEVAEAAGQEERQERERREGGRPGAREELDKEETPGEERPGEEPPAGTPRPKAPGKKKAGRQSSLF
jgi:replication factor C large subunit